MSFTYEPTEEIERGIFDLFGGMVLQPGVFESNTPNITLNRAAYAAQGFVPLFDPTPAQAALLRSMFKALPVNTLFTKEQTQTQSVSQLLCDQLAHYVDVYTGTNTIELKSRDGTINVVRVVRPLSIEMLEESVDTLLRANAPIKNIDVLVKIIKHYQIDYDYRAIRNNEARIALFDVNRDRFTNGDDAVRYICYAATGTPVLIKSDKVVESVRMSSNKISNSFLQNHLVELSQVFNRHKRLILALKCPANAQLINQITRLSKKNHKPVGQSYGSTFVSYALSLADYGARVRAASRLTLRDAFKCLQYVQYKKNGLDTDVFMIRNGRMHVEEGRPTLDRSKLIEVEKAILSEIVNLCSHLKGRTVRIDPHVTLGLPVSRKQTVGNLPFGTTVQTLESKISAGVFWRNEWGAYDIDLSAIKDNGLRVGWGYNGGQGDTELQFSGDVVGAPEGAFEFFTQRTDSKTPLTYGLVANIYSGDDNSKCEVVVGTTDQSRWIDRAIIREKVTLTARSCVVGLVDNGVYVVGFGAASNDRVSSSAQKSLFTRLASVRNMINVPALLTIVGAKVTTDTNVDVDYDLTYGHFTYETLERMFRL